MEPFGEATDHATWEAGLQDEIQFWNEWFSTKGLRWPEQYLQRLDPARPIDEHLIPFFKDVVGEEISILDVGAGPLTILGKVWERPIRITAVDALADVYDRILRAHRVDPPVRTTWCHGELIARRFPRNSFDLVWASNSLDHSYNPLEVILQTVDVVKIGRCVRLSHAPNEAENEKYSGLHKWNFCGERGRFIIWSKTQRIDVSAILAPFADVELLRPDPSPEVAIRKRRDRPRSSTPLRRIEPMVQRLRSAMRSSLDALRRFR